MSLDIDPEELERRKSQMTVTAQRERDHSEVVEEIVQQAGDITPGDLYERYCERVEHPVAKATVRSYCRDLVDAGEIRAEGDDRKRTYHAIDGGAD